MTSFLPADHGVRLRIKESLDENLFVEAGAGTGKTTALVDRVVSLVSTGRTTMNRIAAITFTEMAAAELRDRIRESLEKGAEDETRSDMERERCRAGANDLDHSSIQTLHSFAASILRERPIEAGLPPSFEVMDAITSGMDVQESWLRWLDEVVEDPKLAPSLSLAMALGLGLSQLKPVAERFHQEYDRLEATRVEVVPPVAPRALSMLKNASTEIGRLCRYSNLEKGDPLYRHARELVEKIERLSGLEEGTVLAYRRLKDAGRISHSGGNQTNWSQDPISGENACRQLKSLLEELERETKEELVSLRSWALVPLLGSLRQFVLNRAMERKQQGRAGFQDLLVWTRDLLQDNLEVRDHYRNRYTHLLIDEAQDTDPLQAEIAMFLAEEVRGPDAPRPRDWREIRPVPGKLFVVGDPKQSIYRFRRADVEQMKELRASLGGDTVALVQNFRSQRPVLSWVNHLFGKWMKEDAHQTGYLPVEPRWEADTQHPYRPQVWRLGEETNEKTIGPVRRSEAQSVAALLGEMVGEGWEVLDREKTGALGKEQYRPVKYSDICILMPTRTSLRSLELALEQKGVPYRLEGVSMIYDTQEVGDLVNCLRAIDDPSNQVALVAALRCPAFACSDLDLLQFRSQGGRFNYLSSGQGPEGRVLESLKELEKFHRRRLWDSTAKLLEEFIRERQLMEVALEHPRTREQWRRYRFMVEQARAFAGAGGNSLRAFLEWVDIQREEGARVTEVPLPEGDEESVRVMTIHAAKGLEFPVVVLTGLHNDRRRIRNQVLFGGSGEGVEVRVGAVNQTPFETRGYEELAQREDLMEEAEYVRLLYVATTRARDHLVLGLSRRLGDGKSAAARIDSLMRDGEELWGPIPEVPVKEPMPEEPEAIPAGEASTLEQRERWLLAREETLKKQSRPISVAATTLAKVAKEESGTEEPWRKGRGGSSLGRAVHAVLQTVDLATGAGLAETARAQATAEGLPQREEEVLSLARTALDSQVVKRAVASGRVWREVPVAAPLEGGAIEGFIDLLFEEEDGLVVVDYKTDAIDEASTPEAAQRYRLQGGGYAWAIEQVTKKPVKEVVFLFLRPSREERIGDIAAMTAEAKEQAAAYFRV